MGVRFRELGRELREPAWRRDRRRRGVAARFAVDDDQRAQAGRRAGLRIEARREFGIRHRDRGAGIGEIELQQVRRRQRVDQERHEAGAHRAEECGRIGRGIVEEQQHAVAALQAKRRETVAPAASFRAKLGIAAGPRGSDQRRLVAAALGELVEQHAAGIVGLRNGKADFTGARAVGGHLVADLAAHAASPPFFSAS